MNVIDVCGHVIPGVNILNNYKFNNHVEISYSNILNYYVTQYDRCNKVRCSPVETSTYLNRSSYVSPVSRTVTPFQWLLRTPKRPDPFSYLRSHGHFVSFATIDVGRLWRFGALAPFSMERFIHCQKNTTNKWCQIEIEGVLHLKRYTSSSSVLWRFGSLPPL